MSEWLIPSAYADEFEVKEDLTVTGTGGTLKNPNLEVKGNAAVVDAHGLSEAVEEGLGGDDTEGKLRVSGQEMAIFADEPIRRNPLRVGRNEGISRFEALQLIFVAQLERYHVIFIDGSQGMDQSKELARTLRGQVANHLLDDGPWQTHQMAWMVVDQPFKQVRAGALRQEAKAEDEFVGIKDEQQVCDARGSLGQPGGAGWPPLRRDLRTERVGRRPGLAVAQGSWRLADAVWNLIASEHGWS